MKICHFRKFFFFFFFFINVDKMLNFVNFKNGGTRAHRSILGVIEIFVKPFCNLDDRPIHLSRDVKRTARFVFVLKKVNKNKWPVRTFG